MQFALFFLLGWLLGCLGIALAMRSWSEHRGDVPVMPSDRTMRRFFTVAFVGYVLLAIGHVGTTVLRYHLTNPSISVVDAGRVIHGVHEVR
ncbi:MAG: hypothetical protein AAFQ42_05915 [Pseudomonadota bacterium]